MRILGGVLLVLAALFTVTGYRAYKRRALAECEGFLDFLSAALREISVSGAPLDRLVRRCGDGPLFECGFYAAFLKEGSLASAFETVRTRLSIPKDAAKMLSDLFAQLGRSSVGCEVRLLENGVSELKEIITEYKRESERSMRVVSVVAVAIALGISILLV